MEHLYSSNIIVVIAIDMEPCAWIHQRWIPGFQDAERIVDRLSKGIQCITYSDRHVMHHSSKGSFLWLIFSNWHEYLNVTTYIWKLNLLHNRRGTVLPVLLVIKMDIGLLALSTLSSWVTRQRLKYSVGSTTRI